MNRCFGGRSQKNFIAIRAFMRRDWGAVAEAKARYWAERKRAMTPDEAVARVLAARAAASHRVQDGLGSPAGRQHAHPGYLQS